MMLDSQQAGNGEAVIQSALLCSDHRHCRRGETRKRGTVMRDRSGVGVACINGAAMSAAEVGHHETRLADTVVPNSPKHCADVLFCSSGVAMA